MDNKTYVDPPMGWQYGFPKPLPDPEPDNLYTWLVSEGYPQAIINELGEHFWVRFFQGTESDRVV